MKYSIPVTQSDLQAYADDQLTPARRREVEDFLQHNPEAAEQVEEYRRLNAAIHELYDPVLEEPIPAQLSMPSPNRWRGSLRAAAVAGWMMLGGLIGWQMHPDSRPVAKAEPLHTHLVQPAAFAHTVYASEVRHPVEVSGQEEQHLVKWLSKRLHTELKAPKLSGQGYELVGGRLLPSTNRMAAQFMYQREDGKRVTLYLRQGAWQNHETAFQFTQQEDAAVFFWIDGPLGYALVGDLDRAELLRISEAIYHQVSLEDPT